MATLVLESPVSKVSKATRDFLAQPKKLLIGGNWVNLYTETKSVCVAL
jgi:hypothetical protein